MKKRDGALFCFLMIMVWSTTTLSYGVAPDTLWTKTYGGENDDFGFSVQQTTDGGYIMTGKTMPVFGRFWDVYLLKTTVNGDTLWKKTYGSAYDDLGTSVQQTRDGGYIVAGSTQPLGLGYVKVYLIKTDIDGDTLWTKTLGGTDNDAAYAVQQTSDDGYIIAGYSFSWVTGGPDVYLIKTDANGDTIWTRTYGGLYDDMAYSVQQTADGGYIVAGLKGAIRDHDVYLLKTDTNGDTLWTKVYGGRYDDVGSAVQQTKDGGYVIVGHTTSFGAGDDPDVYLIKTDAKGDTLWTKTYGGPDYDVGYSVQHTADNGYIVVGYTGQQLVPGRRANFDVYIIRTDAIGDTLWTKTYGGTDVDIGTVIQPTKDGGYIIIGQTNSFGVGSVDVYLLKIKPEPGH